MTLIRFVLTIVLISGLFNSEISAINVTVNGTDNGNVAISPERTVTVAVDDSGGDQVEVTLNFPGVSTTWNVNEGSSCRGTGSGVTDTNPSCNDISFTTTWDIPNSWDPRDDQLTVSWRVTNSSNSHRNTSGSYTLTAVLIGNCHYDETIHCGTVYQGNTTHANNSITRYSGCLNDNFHGRDQVFKVVKPSHQGRLTVNLFNNNGLDLFLMDGCNDHGVNCIDYRTITSSTPYAGVHQQVGAGTYYIAVDAASSSVYGDYYLSATCGYLDCHQATQLHCEETVHGSTHQGDNDISAISCDNNLYGGYTGKEKLYYFELTEQQEVTIQLNNIEHGKNLDLFLLSECDEYSTIACSQRTSNSAETITRTLHAGTYYVLVDGYNGSNGNYQLTVDWNCCQPTYDYNCHAITHEYIGTNGDLRYRFQVPSTSQYLGAIWTVRGGEYGSEDTEIGSGFTLEWTFPQARDYIVCVKYPLQYSPGCYDYCCTTITVTEPCETTYDYNCHAITSTYIGTNGQLRYRYEVPNTSLYLGATWIVQGGEYGHDGVEIGTGFSAEWTFPTSGNYTICVKYQIHNVPHCYAYCCKTFHIEPICEDFYNYNCDFFTYHFTGSSSALTYSFTNNSSNTAESWTVSGGGFSNPQTIGSGNNITYTFPAPGQYTICFKYLQHNGCYYYCCKTITVEYPCEDFYNYNCDFFTYHFTGSSSALTYSFTNNSSNTAESWTVSGGGFSTPQTIGSGNNITYTFPAPGQYTICFKYLQHNGCYYYCCKTITVEYPCEDFYNYNCDFFTYHFTGSSSALTYSFTNNSSNTAESWTVSGGGFSNPQTIGSGNNITYTFPAPGQYTICFKYLQHNGCYYYCCKTITVEYPCEDFYNYNCDFFTYHFTGSSSALTYSFTNNSSNTAESWTVSGGGFSTPQTIGSGNNITYTFPAPGQYTICFKYLQHNGCYYYCCKTITVEYPCEDHYDYDCNHITYNSIGTNGQLRYRFEVPSTSQYLGATWIIRGGQYGTTGVEIGTGFSAEWTFPTGGSYTICIKYPQQGGGHCYNYCCKTIHICEDHYDYHCTHVGYQFIGTSSALTYRLTSSASASDGTWTISGGSLNGMTLGSGNNITYTFPSAGQYTVCYKYRKDDGCYYYCCKTICVEYPFDCRAIKRHFDYNAGQYTLNLEGISAADIVAWTNDTTGENLGSGTSVNIHNPYECVTISVKYKDPVSNCYKICCIRLCRVCYGEQDMVCDALTWYYDHHAAQYRFSVPSNGNYNGGTWTIKGAAYGRDVKNGGTGTSLSWTFPSSGKYTVCYTYRTYDGAIFSCCKTIFVQDPSNCDKIVTKYDASSGQYVLSLRRAEAAQVEWRSSNSNQVLGSDNEVRINNPSSCQYIYATYFDKYAGCYTYCRVEICHYEACFSVDPYFSSPWLAGLVAHFETLCSSNSGLRILAGYYRGQCVIVAPPIADPCGGAPTGGGYVLDAAGNFLFSYGGINSEHNLHLLDDIQNANTFWSCNGNLSDDDTEKRAALNTDTDTGTVLLSNQPNPFSGETLIRFQLPSTMEATISVVNAMGQLVFERTDTFTEGENEVFFEADQHLAAGIYFLQLQGDDINRSSTMVIERQQ